MAGRLRNAPAREVARSLAVRYVPIVRWLPAYPRAWLRPDLIAGLTSWGVMVPIALAYAGLAGVPAEFGLITAMAAMAAYAVFGTSRHLKVTVTSTMAVMSASVIADMTRRDPSAYLGLTAALALIVGVMLVAGGIARLGFISDFLTKSVVTGFIVGVSITVIVGQLPKLLGLPSLTGSLPQQVEQLIGYLPATNLLSLAVGVGAIVIIFLLRRFAPRIPGPLVVLVLGILATKALDLTSRGIAVVGEVAMGLPSPGIPSVPLADLPFLVVGAVGIVFLAVGESVGTARAYASRHHDELDADQELLALGTANLASGLFGGFVTDASLSQTATAETAGARSQLSSLITAGLVLATALFLAPLFADLPATVLGAIVITSVVGLINIGELRRYWRWRRTDFVIAIAAMVGVLLTTVLTGMLVAMLLSVVLLLFRASRPYVAALGRMPGYRASYGDLARHPEAEPVPGLVIVRLDAPLYFFNANVAKTQILDLVHASSSPPAAVLIDLAATADLDVTTADMLFDLVRELQAQSIDVLLAQVKGSVRDRLERTGLLGEIGKDRIYMSVGLAVTDLERRREATAGLPGGAGPSTDGAGQRKEAGQDPAPSSSGDPA